MVLNNHEEELCINNTEEEFCVEDAFENVTETVDNNQIRFTVTEDFEMVIEDCITALRNKFYNNCFIITKSNFFKSQIAEYFAMKIEKHDFFEIYTVIKIKSFNFIEYMENILKYVVENKNRRHIILYIENFDEKLGEEIIENVFLKLNYLKELMQLEDLKLVATISEEIQNYSNAYYENYMNYDSFFLKEPVESMYNKVLNDYIENLKPKDLKFSKSMRDRFLCMYSAIFISKNMFDYLKQTQFLFSYCSLNGVSEITNKELEEVLFSKKTLKYLESKDQRKTAVHEAGHTVIAWLLLKCKKSIYFTTIYPDCGSNMGKISVESMDEIEWDYTRENLIRYMAYTLASVVAYEFEGFKRDIGVKSDIKSATKEAKNMVRKKWRL